MVRTRVDVGLTGTVRMVAYSRVQNDEMHCLEEIYDQQPVCCWCFSMPGPKQATLNASSLGVALLRPLSHGQKQTACHFYSCRNCPPFSSTGLQYMLPATWSAIVAAAARQAGPTAPGRQGDSAPSQGAPTAGNVTLASPVLLARLADLLAVQPALLAGLHHRKGRLAPGYDADIVVRAA
jgi:hypothetical protein